MYDITALGELLIDFTPAGKSSAGMDLFEQNPGGAPANVLACASRLGYRTAFIGKIGTDTQGDFLRKTLQDAGIDTGGLVSDERFFTTMAFVSLGDGGERSFAFARKPGADTQLCQEDVNLSILRESRFFHFGSLSLTDSPSRETTFYALKKAREAHCIISYDPNYRPLLWKSRGQAMEETRRALPCADLIKISEEETELLTGYASPQEAAEYLIREGLQIVAVTLGKDGALVATKDGCAVVPGYPVTAVDTTGAGDAFWGAFLYSLGQLAKTPSETSLQELMTITAFANAAAALCVTKRGAIPAMPSLDEIETMQNIRR